MKKWTYESLKAGGHLLYEVISGSRAYGTNTPQSDTDIRYVYILPLDDILGLPHQEQVSDDTNDCTGYEIGRFMELLATGNPTVIELLGMPEDVVLYKHPVFDMMLKHKDVFVTKLLKNSMGGYARQQIEKAKGQDKMMNWEKERMVRKGPLDFCYINRNQGGSQPLLDWIAAMNVVDVPQGMCGVITELSQANLAAVPVQHMRDIYDLYIDKKGTYTRGLVGDDGLSNTLRSAEVPVGDRPSALMFYNKDGYSMHCKEYKKYEEWLLKRNDARWVDSQKHGQKIDGKNMLHCKRLLEMSREIASGQGVIVRRANAQDLLKIRRGEVDLQELLDWATEEIKVVDALFEASDLPEGVSDDFRHELLVDMRHHFYRIIL